MRAERDLGSFPSPPQRAPMDCVPHTAAAAVMLHSLGARHSPLSPRSRSQQNPLDCDFALSQGIFSGAVWGNNGGEKSH